MNNQCRDCRQFLGCRESRCMEFGVTVNPNESACGCFVSDAPPKTNESTDEQEAVAP